MLYPFNVLRNLARMQARTPVIALLDVDMLPSRTLYTWLADPSGKNSEDVIRQCAAKSVFVMTAFEPEPNPNVTTYMMAAQADLQVGRGSFGREQGKEKQGDQSFQGLGSPSGLTCRHQIWRQI